MDDPAAADAAITPFHLGEQVVQARVGVRDKVEPFGRIGIRTFMPEQHRELFEQLPLFFVSAQDRAGRPWASCLVGDPGFVQAVSDTRLRISAQPGFGDPLAGALVAGRPVGGLGLEFPTRRRNRANGRIIADAEPGAISIEVLQSFGNCAQYINARAPRFVRSASEEASERPVAQGAVLDPISADVIARADTFFIATQSHAGGEAVAAGGMDVSHRGGPSGFVRVVDDGSLVWPDYRGNFFFNTLGNLELDSRCGLLFLDFDTGDTVQLSGRAAALWEWDRDDPAFRGAQRLMAFEVEQCVRISGALPFAWDFLSVAPQFQREARTA